MGKGLSALQKKILKLAYTNSQDDKRADGIHLFVSEIYGKLYLGVDVENPYINNFSFTMNYGYEVDHSAEKPYRSAKSAISRSLRRLYERGLVRHYRAGFGFRTGIKLTHEGKALADKL